MPFNAQGDFTRLYDWEVDRDGGIKILANKMDQEFDGLVQGLNDITHGNVAFSGPIKQLDGTVAAPSYTFKGDTDTGFYRPSEGVIAFSANGTKVVEFTSNGIEISGETVWSSSNDGAGSGLDADLLDGQEGSYYTNASSLNSGTILDARVPSNILRDSAVLASANLASDAVTTAKLIDGAVTEAKLAASAVTTSKVNDNAVTEAKLAASAVTTSKVNDNAITVDKMAHSTADHILGYDSAGNPKTGPISDWASSQGVYSPLDYGAVVDEATVQAAINAAVAAGGGKVLIPEGRHTTTSEIVHDSGTAVTIEGVGRRSTTLVASGNFNALVRLGGASVGLQMRDITLEAGATTTRSLSIDSGALDASFHEVRFVGSGAATSLVFSEAAGFIEWHNCHFIPYGATTVGLELDGHNQTWRLSNCRFSNIGRGFKITGTTNDVEGGRADSCHFVNTGSWAVTLGPSFDTVFTGCSFDQQATSCVILESGSDRAKFFGCYFGAPGGNTTSRLVDIKADSGNQAVFTGNTFYGGATGIHTRATAAAGYRLDGLVVTGNSFLNQSSTCLFLDSVLRATITGNVDKGTPANGSWLTRSTNSDNGDYTFDGNHWHTVTPAIFSTAAVYRWGSDTGIVMRNNGVYSAISTTSASTAHGLSMTPTFVLGTPYTNVGNWFNSVKNATNIGFTWNTVGSPTWSWTAEV
jgi:hypothetical protein